MKPISREWRRGHKKAIRAAEVTADAGPGLSADTYDTMTLGSWRPAPGTGGIPTLSWSLYSGHYYNRLAIENYLTPDVHHDTIQWLWL